jgi:predicted RNase H-like nuclease (RuvC/YqgF family)
MDRFEDQTDVLVRHIDDLLREAEGLREQIDRAQERERGSHFRDRQRRERKSGIDRRREPDH